MRNLIAKMKRLFGGKVKPISYDKPSIKPIHDWRVIFFATLLIILVIGGISFYFYRQVSQGKLYIVDISESGNEVKINNSLLKKTVDEINLREASQVKIKQQKITPPDPSIP